ncbi:hypothetical protein RRG08_038079 [Elysia crispata]|uniref:Uncharacterized protein n=1 Tax=Elysia crispata TaxID=231223 RepID=A0AAE0ZZH3_9GAST|nr:hypothetical protein RRG08_038079 [Elysia crispata]
MTFSPYPKYLKAGARKDRKPCVYLFNNEASRESSALLEVINSSNPQQDLQVGVLVPTKQQCLQVSGSAGDYACAFCVHPDVSSLATAELTLRSVVSYMIPAGHCYLKSKQEHQFAISPPETVGVTVGGEHRVHSQYKQYRLALRASRRILPWELSPLILSSSGPRSTSSRYISPSAREKKLLQISRRKGYHTTTMSGEMTDRISKSAGRFRVRAGTEWRWMWRRLPFGAGNWKTPIVSHRFRGKIYLVRLVFKADISQTSLFKRHNEINRSASRMLMQADTIYNSCNTVDDLTCQGHEREYYNGAINWPGEQQTTIGHVGRALRMSIVHRTRSHISYITGKPLPPEGGRSLTQSMRT